MSKIENILVLNQIVFENFTDLIDLLNDTFRDFTLEEIIPFHVDDRDAFENFSQTLQYGFEDELYEILNEFEVFKEEFLRDFELKNV